MRRIDVLTLGLSAPSRWNPLYRRWVRQRVEANLTAGLKALLLERDDHSLLLSPADLDDAANTCAIMEPHEDGGVLYRIVSDDPPRRPRILWGYPDG